MNIRIGTEEDKRTIIGKYPHTRQVLGEGGCLVVAEENENIEAFAWAFVQKIPAPTDKSEMFVNVIETFAQKNQCKGIASNLIKKLIELAKAQSLYQIRAYCDINNISSHKLWEKNNFTISPVKNQNGQILGSYVTSLL
ncbi:MAG: GNAT family N-acetyltransferase [Clostridia bacterium]|nr:GNAT family N-acetyltransferase [Clostridia bacterium]